MQAEYELTVFGVVLLLDGRQLRILVPEEG